MAPEFTRGGFSPTLPKVTSMRVVTWNLNHDKGAAVWPRLHADLGADLILLQETRRPVWPGGVAWESVPHHDRGSAVLAVNGSFRRIPVPGYQGWVVGGELAHSGLDAGDRPLLVFSVHAPSANPSQPRRSYVEEVLAMLDILEPIVAGSTLVLGGDFNFLSLGERIASEPLQTLPAEREALARLTRLGLVSCWTTAHPGRPLPQTLRWSNDRAAGRSTPYHCDGLFVPASWARGMFCEVLTSVCFEASDHYPVAAWISTVARVGQS